MCVDEEILLCEEVSLCNCSLYQCPESFLSHPNANICTPSMEINITDVLAAQRHSTKYAPCWQGALLFHEAIPETTPTLSWFLLFFHSCQWSACYSNHQSLPSLGSTVLDLIADVMTFRPFLSPCSW